MNEIISADDTVVSESRDALAKSITQRALDALERSLRKRGLERAWARATTDAEGFVWEPPLGRAWATWFDSLTERGLAVTPAYNLLAEAGALPTFGDPDACALIWHVHGWT